MSPPRSLRWAALLLGALTLQCGHGSAGGHGPVVLVSIDTLPADRVGIYGDPSARSPLFDRLARRGIQVRDFISPAPLTLPSHATMLTGVDPPAHGLRDNGLYRLAAQTPTIAEQLPKDVEKAGFVGGFPLHRTFGLGRGFDVWDDSGLADAGAIRHPQRRAGDVLKSAAAWLEHREKTSAPFVFVHLYDPHYPYEAPAPWPAATRARGGDPYDAELGYVDAELTQFVAHVEEMFARAPIFLVTADHGESLGAHLEPTHSNFVYDVTQRIPVALCGPGVPHRLDTRQRRLADVAPTVLGLCGAAAQGKATSLRIETEDSPAYVETMHTKLFKGWAPLYGARTSQWKYIRAPRSELYDLVADPGETADLFEKRPDVVKPLAAFVDSVLADAVDQKAAGLSDDARARLAALGYVASTSDGAPAPADAKDPKDGIVSTAALFHGEQAFLHGDLAAAEGELRKAVAAEPTLKDAHAYLAGVYVRTRRLDLAVREGETALTLSPHVNEAPLQATLGEAYLQLGRPRDAVPHLEKAITASPKDARLQALLARAQAGR